MKYFAFVLGFFAICAVAFAQDGNEILETEVEEQYFQNENQNPDKSIIYIFFNNQPCPTCPQAIEIHQLRRGLQRRIYSDLCFEQPSGSGYGRR